MNVAVPAAAARFRAERQFAREAEQKHTKIANDREEGEVVETRALCHIAVILDKKRRKRRAKRRKEIRMTKYLAKLLT